MAEEIFDVVNDQDEVIDHLPRSEVHRRGLKHRAIHLLVFNAAGELFLQKRSMIKDNHPGVWDSSVSGHVDTGETYDACSVREAGEEIGLKLAGVPERLFKIVACEATDQEFVWVYRSNAEGPFVLHPEEIETGGWFARQKVTAWVAEKPEEFAPALVYIWKLYVEKSG
jgi:isopentenyldiphosphate isomerase